ncbi:hypothetical protein N0V82_003299 [Gnomoniopsis sp. IMI 355080]|nr:hypothetical protein N0V82_003299 [Gnomoniopsis sp. IMI 355080]
MTNITFATFDPELESADGFWQFGMVLPQNALTTDVYDYLGILRCAMTNGSSWCGVSHGAAGQMTNALLLMAWPYQQQVLTSFRYTDSYVLPGQYTGQANLTTLASRVTTGTGNESMFEIVYHCQNCLQWNQGGEMGNVSTSNGGSALGRAAAKAGPSNAGCPSQISFGFHDNGYGQFTAEFQNATSTNYDMWAALPAKPVTLASGCTAATGNSTSTSTPTASSSSTATGTASPSSSATSGGQKVGMKDWVAAGFTVAAAWLLVV